MQLPMLTPLGNHNLIADQRTQKYIDAINQKAQNGSVQNAMGQEENDKLRAVSREFAALFIGEMFKAMDEGEPMSDFGNGGTPEKIFQEMIYEEYARDIANGQGIGLGELAYQGLLRQQGITGKGL